MKYTNNHIATILFGALFLASCASMEPTAHVRDDVYFMPSEQPLAQARPLSESTGEPLPPPPVDYYDADEAKAYSDDRGYYDIVHNDPHYYNQSRFGFGMGMGSMGGGWGMHQGMGWGMGHGMGWGSPWGMSMGWGSPWGMGMGMGMGGYRPWGWNRPWGMYDPWGMYSPWGMGMNNPWGMGMGMGGWGYGPYMGPWGNCFNCYQPLGYFESGTPRTVGHRPSLSGGGSGGHSGSGPVTGNRMMVRDPAGLIPSTTGRPGIGSRPTSTREARPTNTRPTQGRPVYSPPGNRDQYRGRPNYQSPQNAPQRTRPSGTPSTRPSTRPQRNDGGTRPRSTFGGDRSGGSTPSRSIGGSSPTRSIGGGGGGGSRSGGSLRPR